LPAPRDIERRDDERRSVPRVVSEVAAEERRDVPLGGVAPALGD